MFDVALTSSSTYTATWCVCVCAHVHACARTCVHTSTPGRDVLLFGAKSPSLWVKAACLFIKQAVKSASYRTNATVIN